MNKLTAQVKDISEDLQKLTETIERCEAAIKEFDRVNTIIETFISELDKSKQIHHHES